MCDKAWREVGFEPTPSSRPLPANLCMMWIAQGVISPERTSQAERVFAREGSMIASIVRLVICVDFVPVSILMISRTHSEQPATVHNGIASMKPGVATCHASLTSAAVREYL